MSSEVSMTEEFDKEMDALLRQAAQSEIVSENSNFEIQNLKSPHLDADEISLFAENSLPVKMRQRAVVHFADCARCRKVLSDLILLNSANAVISTERTAVFAPIVPWYRKLFAFPNLAYTLGVMVLAFSALAALIVWQSVDQSQNAEVSQVSERQQGGKGMSSDGEAVVVERENPQAFSPNAMSNASMSNSASTFPSNKAMSNASTNSAARSFNANMTSNSSSVSNKSSVSERESPKVDSRSESEAAKQAVTELPVMGRTADDLIEAKRERAGEDKNAAETADTTQSAAAPKPEPTSISENHFSSDAASAKAKKRMRSLNAETSSVGGKSFRRANDVWVDSAYGGQATIVVARGAKEYKKLDSGLRAIAENLGGTVIVVWKEKAYRIQ